MARHDDDGDETRGVVGLELAIDLITVEGWEHDVAHQAVWWRLPDDSERLLAILGLEDVVTLVGQ